MDEITKDLLSAFKLRAKENPGPYPYTVSFDFGSSSKSIFICSAIHGDEVGSIPALLRVIDDIKSKKITYNGKITLALGNVEAIKIGKRFVEEDMNRIFGKTGLNTIDGRRAEEISFLIASHDMLIDLHQTIGPTKSPFYVIRGSEENIQLSKILASAPLAIIAEEAEFNGTGRMTATAYASQKNTFAYTLELSQKGYSPQAESLAYETIVKTLHILSTRKMSDWALLAESAPPLELISIQYSHEFTDPKMRLLPGFANGDFCEKDTILGDVGDVGDHKILAPFDGYIFFPKYPNRGTDQNATRPLPSHLFEFGKVLNS